MDSFVLNGTVYLLHHLDKASADSHLSPYDRRVIQFAQQWLSGQETFTVYTSGSTGKPKAIVLTRAQMVTSARLTCCALGLKPGDRSLVCLSAEYIAGMMMMVRGFEHELQMTIIDPVSRPLAALEVSASFELTAMVPLQLHETLTGLPHERAILDRMKGVLIGGAPVSLALAEQLQSVRAPLYHTYGMTETVSHIALKRLNGPEQNDCFIPFDGVELGLDDRGCLRITSALTRGEALQTNDLAEINLDGSFQWIGRVDNVINSGGVKVQIERVEAALEAWLLQHEAGVYAERRFFIGPLPHPHWGQTVVVVIEGVPFGRVADRSVELETCLRRDLLFSLTRYEIPRNLYFVDKFIETPTGKIDRPANLDRLGTQCRQPS